MTTLFWIGLLVLVTLVVNGTIMKTKWGINVRPVICPGCATEMPRIRKPVSIRQAIWGGFTCPKCGCEMDKWGREIPAA